jgi:5-methylcytosine-specific restriction protein A
MTRLARPCLSCQRPTRNGSRCVTCQRAHDRQRGTRQERGYGGNWERLSRTVTSKAGACEHCGHTGSTDNPLTLTLDHITPLSAGGTNHPQNLRCLCRRCNSSKGGRIARTQAPIGRPIRSLATASADPSPRPREKQFARNGGGNR